MRHHPTPNGLVADGTSKREGPAKNARSPAMSSTSPAVLEQETILLVEDDGHVLSLVRRILRSGGYRVLCARDGRSALNLAVRRALPIDLLLTDVVMPGMTGAELALALSRRFPDMKVLYMSGHAVDGLECLAKREVETSVLRKPFSVTNLLERVEHSF